MEQNKKTCLRPDYKKLFRRPPEIVSKEFSLWSTQNGFEFVRFGVVVPKRNIKLAVNRNKAKRLAKEVFREFRQKNVGKDLVLVIRIFARKQKLQTWKEKLRGVFSWVK